MKRNGAENIFPYIKTEKKTATEAFKNIGTTINLGDFWSWAHSDMLGNTERGKLAEFLVAIAIGQHNNLTDSWNRYDLCTDHGIRIEVESSGYIQTWEQVKESKIIFSIRPTCGWNSITAQYDTQRSRQSDIYVFCLLKHKDQATVNPLDLNQWDFYVLPTAVLNELMPRRKTLTLSGVIKCGAVLCDFSHLHETIKKAGKTVEVVK